MTDDTRAARSNEELWGELPDLLSKAETNPEVQDRVITLLYPELRRIAEAQMRRERRDHTLASHGTRQRVLRSHQQSPRLQCSNKSAVPDYRVGHDAPSAGRLCTRCAGRPSAGGSSSVWTSTRGSFRETHFADVLSDRRSPDKAGRVRRADGADCRVEILRRPDTGGDCRDPRGARANRETRLADGARLAVQPASTGRRQ